MTTDNTGEYPLRTLEEMRAARERGDEIYFQGVALNMENLLVYADDMNTLWYEWWTARPRKPKEFGFWEAGRRVAMGEAMEMITANIIPERVAMISGSLCFLKQRASVPTNATLLGTKWTLIGNDGKPVFE